MTLTGDTVFGASISPDASRIAVGCTDNTVRILDAASGKELFKIGNHENWVLGTIFGVDGKRIVSVGRDRAAKLTDATSGAFLENVNLLRGELAAIARHPTKDVIVIGGEDRVPYIYMMDRAQNMKIADDSTLIRKLERQDGTIAALAWSSTMASTSRWAERRRKSPSTTRIPASEWRRARGIGPGFMRSRSARMGRRWPPVDSMAKCGCIGSEPGNW